MNCPSCPGELKIQQYQQDGRVVEWHRECRECGFSEHYSYGTHWFGSNEQSKPRVRSTRPTSDGLPREDETTRGGYFRCLIAAALLLIGASPVFAGKTYRGSSFNGRRSAVYEHGDWAVYGDSSGGRLAVRRRGNATFWSNGYDQGVMWGPYSQQPMKPWIMR